MAESPEPNTGSNQQLVPGLVDAQSRIRPDALAVSESFLSITYGQLTNRSDALTLALRSLGASPDVPVALFCKSSAAMVIGALGIMKAGAAYLPLDPAWPADRIATMLNDAQVQTVVAIDGSLESVPAGSWNVVALDSDGNVLNTGAAADVARTAPTLSLDTIAYIIYTSGSTGQPKGVQVPHRGLLNLIQWHQEAFRVTPLDRASQVAGVGFDAAVWEIWPYLTAGASVHIANAASRTEPEALRDWMLANGITIGFVPTLMAERMIRLAWPKQTLLRIMLTGADTLHHYPPADLPFTLVNNYGPTECSVVTTSGTVLPNGRPVQRPSIGKPISKVEVYILNQRMKRVPPGSVGEIYIGGAGVAHGYLNRPQLTAERFLPNPFSSEPGALMYRTGDLGCYQTDGQIAFLGRIDQQIKIRGFRIEPNEIVSLLNQHHSVKESAVMARDSSQDDKRLVAYVVATSVAELNERELRSFLGSRLPDYMVPSTFVQVGALPVNANGKVDLQALPAPDAENTLRSDEFVAPRNEVEQRLAEILAPLLGLDQVSVEDNFFLLGGHSLLGTQLIARVRDNFSVELSLRALFEAATIANLAVEIERLLIEKLESMSDADVERLLNLSNNTGAPVNIG